MSNEIIIGSLVFYLAIGTIAESWFTLYRIGKNARKILPQFFAAHWSIWKWLGQIPFALYAGTLLFSPRIFFGVTRLVFIPVWLFVVLTGRYLALKTYRMELQKINKDCSNEEIRESIRVELSKTNSQIIEEMESYINSARNYAQHPLSPFSKDKNTIGPD